MNSGKVIEVVQASTQPGEILVQRTYGGPGARRHQWILILIPTGQDPSQRVYKIMNRNSRLVLDTETNNTSIVIRGLVVIFPGGDKCGGVHVGGHYPEPEQRQGS